MMDVFQVDWLIQERRATGAAWLPFLQSPLLEMGIYVVASDDEATHVPHTRDDVYYAVKGTVCSRCRAKTGR